MMRRNRKERNRTERGWILLGCACLVLFGIYQAVQGTGLYVVRDPNCVQTTWGAVVPFAFDPNATAGILLHVEQVTAGKYNRVGTYCDPEGDPVTVELLAGPAGVQITQNREGQTWTIAGELLPGVHAIIVRAVDDPKNGEPNDVVVTVLVEARPRPNTPPVVR
jgi:hypothetical protein